MAKDDVTLWMSSQIATKLEQEKKEREAARLKLSVEKTQAKMMQRRARQEQELAQRAHIQAIFTTAKRSEDVVDRCCSDLEEVLLLKGDSKNRIIATEEALAKAEQKAENAKKRTEASVQKLAEAVGRVSYLRASLEEVTQATDPSIIRLKQSRLSEAFNTSSTAWDQVQKAIRKKERNRLLKKRAKGLIERSS